MTRKKFLKKKCVKVVVFVLSHPEISIFVSCVMVCDAIRFVLRHFLGFLSCFYLFTLQLIHFSKIRGLERLKIRFLLFWHKNYYAFAVQ